MLRSRVLRTGLVSALMILSSQVFAVPGAMTAVYDVYRNNKSVGYLESTLMYSGDQYEYKKTTKATGWAKLLTNASITEKSAGKIAGHAIIPLTYLYDERTRSKTRVEQARFVQGQATGIYKDKAYTVVTPANVVDRSALEMVVARDLKRGLPTLVYPVMERGEVKTYTVVRLGSEKLQTNAGVFNTIKVSVKRADNNRETTFWMAEELDYLPAQMYHREKDSIIKSILNRYSRGR